MENWLLFEKHIGERSSKFESLPVLFLELYLPVLLKSCEIFFIGYVYTFVYSCKYQLPEQVWLNFNSLLQSSNLFSSMCVLTPIPFPAALSPLPPDPPIHWPAHPPSVTLPCHMRPCSLTHWRKLPSLIVCVSLRQIYFLLVFPDILNIVEDPKLIDPSLRR